MSSTTQDAAPETLARDVSFHGMTVTQFLGAFNDNAFKQVILLLAIDLARNDPGAATYQPIATGLFAVPFVIFSGLAGSLADRVSKTSVIVWMKVLEIVVMVLGAVAFYYENMLLLLATLFLMAAQSAFFGPAKYGILPEMIRPKDLAKANGVIQMTTFLAIILGLAIGGWLKDSFPGRLYVPGMIYTVLAVLGTGTALLVRRMPPAQPDLAVFRNPFGDLWPTLGRIRRDRSLLLVILYYSYFWFLGGVFTQMLNLYGKALLFAGQDEGFQDTKTSLLLVSVSIGMAAGFPLGGFLSRGKIAFRLANWGIAGVVLGLAALAFLASPSLVWAVHAVLFLIGLSAGLFALPLQTYIQVRPPEGEKGRVIGAMNFVNFLFIGAASGYEWVAEKILQDANARWIPMTLAVFTAAIAIWLYPAIQRLARSTG